MSYSIGSPTDSPSYSDEHEPVDEAENGTSG